MRTHAHSEATRLLCAGAWLHAGFRQRVVEELVVHAERPVAPSLGVDVRTVLAHALQARRQQVLTALALSAVWVGFFTVSLMLTWDLQEDLYGPGPSAPLSDLVWSALFPLFAPAGVPQPLQWVFLYASLVLWLWAGRALRGREALLGAGTDSPPRPVRSALRRGLGRAVTFFGRVSAVMYWIVALVNVAENPYPVIFPLLMVAVVWLHRVRVTAVLRERLGRESFATAPQPGLPHAERYRRIGEAIDREQHAPATLYDANRPFIGAGVPHKPWSFALELRRKKESPFAEPAAGVPPQAVHGVAPGPVANGAQAEPARGYPVQPPHPGAMPPPLTPEGLAEGPFPEAESGPGGQPEQPAPPGPPSPYHLSSRHVIDMITPRLVALRDATAHTGRDRLRDLEIEEFVYLPSGAARDSGVYAPESIRQHLSEAADDGGEARRHFLRIRVGAWHEQVVVSLFVRVHTQGGMLVLEVVPHVLGPVAEEFRKVDAIVESRAGGPLREGLLAFLTAPAVTVSTGAGALRTAVSAARIWLSAPEHAAPDAPLVSVRELGSTGELSLFQEMDVSRYIKTVQDRIASGVRDALEQRGFRTDRFEQQIVNVRDGGVYIEDMSGGAVATGDHGTAQHLERSPA